MGRFSRLKDLLVPKRAKKPRFRASTGDEESESATAAPEVIVEEAAHHPDAGESIPSISNDHRESDGSPSIQPKDHVVVANNAIPGEDLWTAAYESAQKEDPELMNEFAENLRSHGGLTTDVNPFENLDAIKSIVEHLEVKREEKQWRLPLIRGEVKIREQAEKLAKFLIWSDGIVKTAVSSQPFAALAWSGAMLVVPLLTAGATQHLAMLSGFNSVNDILVYWNICEDTYLRGAKSDSRSKLVQLLVKLYSLVIQYQAHVVCHLSISQVSRALQKIEGQQEWDERLSDIEKLSQRCRDCLAPLEQQSAENNFNLQLGEMQRSQEILDQIREGILHGQEQTKWYCEDENEEKLLHAFASNYESFKDFNPPKVDGTCEWFFRDERFHAWRENRSNGLLWVSAGPGCGKSVLSKALIDEGRLSTKVVASTVCHFFFKDGDTRRMSATQALSAILHQIFIHDPSGSLIKYALPSHRSYGNELCRNFSELWKILAECVASSETEIVCVFDALDECEKSSGRELINALKTFFLEGKERSSKIKILVTSRPYDYIERDFKNFSAAPNYVRFDGDERSEDIAQEINLVIDARVKSFAADFNQSDRKNISDRLKQVENRTYLWLHLIFGVIEQRPSDYSRRVEIEKLLSNLPSDVSAVYEEILNRNEYDGEKTKRLLQLVLAAERPLTLDEANIALTLATPAQDIVSHDDMNAEMWPTASFSSVVKNLCGLLINVHDGTLSFIHQTVREFLTGLPRGKWGGRFRMSDAHTVMWNSCYNYLGLQGFREISVEELSRGKHRKTYFDEYLFFNYAAQNWSIHYNAQEDSVAEMHRHNARLLCDMSQAENKHWACMDISMDSRFDLLVATHLGLKPVVEEILEEGPDGDNQEALHIAVLGGHTEIVHMLLENGGNAQPELCTAASENRVEILKVLLSKDVDINAPNDLGRCALHIALFFRNEEIVKTLLSNGADIDATDDHGYTALHFAAMSGDLRFVQILLEGGFGPNTKSSDGTTVLHSAAASGNEAAVELLVEKGVDIDARNNEGLTALHLTVCRPYDMGGVIQFLIDHGASIEARSRRRETPLHLAVSHRWNSKSLVENGANVRAKDIQGQTALHIAVSKYNTDALKLLLDHGAEVNAQDELGRTPLHLSLVKWLSPTRERNVRLLLKNGADPNIRNNEGKACVENKIFQGLCRKGVLGDVLDGTDGLALSNSVAER